MATITTASDRAAELLHLIKAGTATAEDVTEAVELLALTGTTLSGKQPERILKATRH
jgi:hypothetical protein